MHAEIPNPLITSMVIASLLAVIAVWLIIHLANRNWKTSFSIGLGLAVWYGLVFFLGQQGFFGVTILSIPMIAVAFVVLFLFGRTLYRNSALLKVMEAVPVHWLIGVQIFRVMGYGFLSFYSLGLIPGKFAIPTAVGDIIIGMTAPVVAILALKRLARTFLVWWNYFGIADLILALSLGTLTYPRPVQVIPAEPSNELIALFPLVLVPLFAVPVSILLHLFTLKRLKTM